MLLYFEKITFIQFEIYFLFSFEPEVFPALIYRMVKPRAVFLMFVNGKVVLTGNFNFQFLSLNL